MKILLITPVRPSARAGNWVTAARYAGHLRNLGYRVRIENAWSGAAADLMIALHARRSAPSIGRFAADFPGSPLVVVLTGTDVYRDIRTDAAARQSLELASRLVTLQNRAADELALRLRNKARVIYQSAAPMARRPPLRRHFEVLVVGHLREEKDPFRAAYACAGLPAESRIRVVQLGGAFGPEWEAEAARLMRDNPRYLWRGEVPHAEVRRHLARAPLMVISSRMEGGANVVGEACVINTPVIASDIPGNIGMLGDDYAGYYPLEDDEALAALLWRAESDAKFHARLAKQCAARAVLFTPEREREGLRRVLAEL